MDSKSKARIRKGAWLFAFIVAASAFAPHLEGPFIFDDQHTIRDNPALRRSINPAFFFKDPKTASRATSTLVRPLLTWTYALNYRVSGPDASSFRTVNLAVHAINALLVMLLTMRAGRLARLAPACALLFFLHPLTGVQVGYASCRSTLLSSTFYLGAMALFAWTASRQRDARPVLLFVSAACIALLYACGLFTKSAASTLPAALVLWHLAFNRGEAGPWRNRTTVFTASTLALLFTVLGLYFLYRHAFHAPSFFAPRKPWPVWAYLAAQARIFWTYVRFIALPVNLSIEHGAWMPEHAGELARAGFLVSVSGIVALAGLSMAFLRRLPELSFAALFSMLYLLPTSSVIPLTVLVNENRAYLCVLLLIWPLLFILDTAMKRFPRSSATAIFLAGIFLLGILIERGSAFHSETAVWKDAVMKAPGLARARVNLGVALSGYGREEQARHWFMKTLELDPCSARALTNLANMAYEKGELDRAEWFYNRAMECDPGSMVARLNLAELLFETGRESQGARILEQALGIEPRHSEVLGRLGLWHCMEEQRCEQGLRYLEQAIRYAPSAAEAEKWSRALEKAKYLNEK